jgi:hypothetical protein
VNFAEAVQEALNGKTMYSPKGVLHNNTFQIKDGEIYIESGPNRVKDFIYSFRSLPTSFSCCISNIDWQEIPNPQPKLTFKDLKPGETFKTQRTGCETLMKFSVKAEKYTAVALDGRQKGFLSSIYDDEVVTRVIAQIGRFYPA